MKKTTIFYLVIVLLVLLELVKGMSANGTPPIFQDYEWQLDLAYFMWTSITYIRVVLVGVLIYLFIKIQSPKKTSFYIIGIALLILWGFTYWFFNHYYNGASKFFLLTEPKFAMAADNTIPLESQVLGVNINGVQKAYPLNMMLYHHQFTDELQNEPIWVTYCGLCRSGRVFEKKIDGKPLEFELVGAISYNAVFQDLESGSWWRQEMGEAVKGKYAGRMLEDYPMEQMSLENWLLLYPGSQILQYDPQYQERYAFVDKVFLNEDKNDAWRGHELPPLIIGLEIGDIAKAYNWDSLKIHRLVMDKVADKHLLLLSSQDGTSPFAYDRNVKDDVLEFEINGDNLVDMNTKSTWNKFGRCTNGELEGTQLAKIQIYQQNDRSWRLFHPESTYYEF